MQPATNIRRGQVNMLGCPRLSQSHTLHRDCTPTTAARAGPRTTRTRAVASAPPRWGGRRDTLPGINPMGSRRTVCAAISGRWRNRYASASFAATGRGWRLGAAPETAERHMAARAYMESDPNGSTPARGRSLAAAPKIAADAGAERQPVGASNRPLMVAEWAPAQPVAPRRHRRRAGGGCACFRPERPFAFGWKLRSWPDIPQERRTGQTIAPLDIDYQSALIRAILH
jgi:hypothetical protein